jgi:DNA topoisomerase-1
LVTKLKGLAKKAEMVWLASDEDREVRSYFLAFSRRIKFRIQKKTKRIVFHEITKNAI